ncbi:hypothetical protein HFD88_008568 [Aspergillus terreus]|nr:hypothetical protein HFD88_008568 [Aspergillus terreus]
MVPDPPTPGPPSDEGKIKRASAACGECKRRRTKCSADTTGSPCTECAIHGRECIIDEYADKRRKVAAKRAQEELKYYRGFLEQLIEAIRTGDGVSVDAIINIIRSGASHEEILAVVTQSLSGGPKKRKALDMSENPISTASTTPDGTSRTPDNWT